MLRLHKTLTILLLIASAIAACSSAVTPPGPNTLSGSMTNVGYFLHRWDQGLNLLILHDAPQSFFCEGAASSSSPEYMLNCTGESNTDGEFSWEIRTRDGRTARVIVDEQSFDVIEDSLILINASDGLLQVERQARHLSDVPFEHSAILELAESDEVIQSFIARIKEQ
ncbi:MAG: hypothetical protein PVG02_00505 [Anaerolineales bacterium]